MTTLVPEQFVHFHVVHIQTPQSGDDRILHALDQAGVLWWRRVVAAGVPVPVSVESWRQVDNP